MPDVYSHTDGECDWSSPAEREMRGENDPPVGNSCAHEPYNPENYTLSPGDKAGLVLTLLGLTVPIAFFGAAIYYAIRDPSAIYPPAKTKACIEQHSSSMNNLENKYLGNEKSNNR